MRIIINILMKFVRIFYIIFSILIRLLFTFHRERILIKQGSKYNHLILISECGSRRIMRFNSLSNGCQAQIDLKQLDYPVVNYIQLMIISLLYSPSQLTNANILIIGLGGGTLPRALRKLSSMSLITIIEIDPLVDEMARKYFSFNEDSKMKVFIMDGRSFIQNHLSNKTDSYQMIFVDAYDYQSGLPSHMKSQEFFLELKSSLDQLGGGLLIINLVCIYQSFVHVYQTIQSVFGIKHLLIFHSNDFVNIVLIASTLSIEYFPRINQQSNLIEQMKEKLSLDVHSLLKCQREQQFSNEHFSTHIYHDDMPTLDHEEQMSLTQFVNIV